MQLQINHEPRSFTTAKLQRKFSARVCSACQIDLTSCKLCKSNIMDQTLARFAPPRRAVELRGVADLRSSVRSTALRASDPQVKLTRDAGPETTHSVVSRRPRLLGRAGKYSCQGHGSICQVVTCSQLYVSLAPEHRQLSMRD